MSRQLKRLPRAGRGVGKRKMGSWARCQQTGSWKARSLTSGWPVNGSNRNHFLQADFTGLIPPWKLDSLRLAIRELARPREVEPGGLSGL